MSRPQNDPDNPAGFEIRIKGHLDRRWTARFDGLSMRLEPDGTTVISAPLADQAALHGLLQRVRDTGLPLVSVVRTEPDQLDPSRTEAGKKPTPRRSKR